MVIENFAVYNRHGWHLWSLRVCSISIQDLLTFRVFIEKTGIILISLPLFVTGSFSPADFDIVSLFGIFSVLITTCWNSHLSLCAKFTVFNLG